MENLVQVHGWYQLDVCSEFDILDGDVMALKALESSYQEQENFGTAQDQVILVNQGFKTIYVPALRYT